MPAKPKTIVMPSDAEASTLAMRAQILRAEILAKKSELDDIEARLEAYALEQPHELLANEAREGRRVRLPHSVAVVFTADELIGSFKDCSAKHNQLAAIAGSHLTAFFREPCDWNRAITDGQKFRQRITETFAPSTATAFLAACRAVDGAGIPKSKTLFEYPAS